MQVNIGAVSFYLFYGVAYNLLLKLHFLHIMVERTQKEAQKNKYIKKVLL